MTTRTFSVVPPANLKPMTEKWRKTVDRQKVGPYPADDGSCCVLCGKLAKDATSFALLSDGGSYVTKDEWNRDHDLGMFPVGSDCVKKLTKGGIPTYTLSQLKA